MIFFFFSSRRRHTRLVSDWSSDVCSSDLTGQRAAQRGGIAKEFRPALRVVDRQPEDDRGGRREQATQVVSESPALRSEERRVGKEGRWRRWGGENRERCGAE